MNTTEEKIGGDPFDVQACEPEQKMLYINGSKTSFHCDCCCNVFTKISRDRYRCNSCRTIYECT
jgi:hypothetical protein